MRLVLRVVRPVALLEVRAAAATPAAATTSPLRTMVYARTGNPTDVSRATKTANV